MITLEKIYSWHRECFVCKRCRQQLMEQNYFKSGEDLFCPDCIEPIAQCNGCKRAINRTVSYVKHKKHNWHTECFKCVLCQSWLANGAFHEMDDNLMCTKCYTIKVSKKCATCQENIESRGVQFGLMRYHQDCFQCSNCDEKLYGESKIKEKDGQPVCYNCYLKIAKKCFRCKGPITSRHTLYKGQPFHIECFKCNLCGSNIDGAEFYETSLNEILCIKCARIE